MPGVERPVAVHENDGYNTSIFYIQKVSFVDLILLVS